MTPDEARVRYEAIAGHLEPCDLTAIWAAVLFGRRGALPENLRAVAVELDLLRDDVGRASALRNENARSDAA